MSTKELRRSPRAKSDLVFEIFGEADHLVSGVGRLLNVSEVGGLLESTVRLDSGQQIRAHVRLDNRSMIQMDARIVWLKPKRQVIVYGIEFLKMGRADLGRLSDWIKSRKS